MKNNIFLLKVLYSKGKSFYRRGECKDLPKVEPKEKILEIMRTIMYFKLFDITYFIILLFRNAI